MPRRQLNLPDSAMELYSVGYWVVPFVEDDDGKRPTCKWKDRRLTEDELRDAIRGGATSTQPLPGTWHRGTRLGLEATVSFILASMP